MFFDLIVDIKSVSRGIRTHKPWIVAVLILSFPTDLASLTQVPPEVTLYLLSTSTLTQCSFTFEILPSLVASLSSIVNLIRQYDAGLSDIHDIKCYAQIFKIEIKGYP